MKPKEIFQQVLSGKVFGINHLAEYYLWILVISVGLDKLGITLFSRLIPWLWVAGFALIGRQLGHSGVFLVKRWKNNLIPIVSLALLISLILYSVFSPTAFSYETAWETNCGLEVLKGERLWSQDCYFGYPATQFLVTSLPSLILGRSLVNLKLGGGVFLTLSLVIFWAGLVSRFKEKAGLVSLFSAGIFLSFFYFNHWGSVFGQSILPFCYALIVFSFHSGSVPDHPLPEWKLYVGFLGFFSYPTALALTGLMLIYYVSFRLSSQFSSSHRVTKTSDMLNQKKGKKYIGRVSVGKQINIDKLVLASLVVGSMVLAGRSDLRLEAKAEPVSSRPWIVEVADLFTKQNGALISPILAVGIIGFLVMVVIQNKSNRLRILGVWWWILVGLAILLPGVGGYSLYFKLHRVLVGLPVLVIMFGQALNIKFYKSTESIKKSIGIKHEKAGSLVLKVVVGLILLNGLVTRIQFENNKTVADDVLVLELLERMDVSAPKIIAFTPIFQSSFLTLNRSLEYFYPKMSLQMVNNDCSEYPQLTEGTILITQVGELNTCQLNGFLSKEKIVFTNQLQAEIWQKQL